MELENLQQELKNKQREIRKLQREIAERDSIISSYKQSTEFQENLYSMVKRQKDEQDIFLNLMLDNSPNIIVLMDINRKFIIGTKCKLRQIGMNADALGEKDFMESISGILSPDSYDMLSSALQEATENGNVVEYLTDLRFNNSELYHEAIAVIPFKNETGDVVGTMLQITDITELKKAIDNAEEASKSKSRFLATMSHEIRTPMNAIIGISQIQLQKSDLPQEYAEALDKIYNSGNNLLGIINDILDLSKIESGKMSLNPAEYDMASFIYDTVQLNIVRIGSKAINFKLDINETLPLRMIGDELRLKQILSNLLSNAIKYTEKGYVKLSVNHFINNGETYLRFIVEDTGQGMKSKDREALFCEYTRFNAEANRNTEGTGIGLNITKRLTELMDGIISVTSEYGKGSVFTVTVRQKAVKCAAMGTELAEQLCGFTFSGSRQFVGLQTARYPMPYGKVLLADDVDTNLYVAKGLLAPYKLEIETAGSGYEVIEKVKYGNTYDLIFMDYMMPGMDGIETTQKLRAMGYKGAIVALTANALAGNDEMFRQNGFDGFISKPIDIRYLNDALNQFVRSRHPEEAKKYEAVNAGHAKKQTANPKLIQLFLRGAEKMAVTLQETSANGNIKLFTTTAHAMKSTLINVGEQDTSEMAFALEKAGLDSDASFIAANLDDFLETLKAVCEKLRRSESLNVYNANIAEDADFLFGQLKIVKHACEDYDDTTAYSALDLLKKKMWKPETAALLERIRDMLFLDSDFENVCAQIDEFFHKKRL